MYDIIIKEQEKSPTQSGKYIKANWRLSYVNQQDSGHSKVGWISMNDTRAELQLDFKNLDAAINYANNHKLSYKVIHAKNVAITPKSYSENFK